MEPDADEAAPLTAEPGTAPTLLASGLGSPPQGALPREIAGRYRILGELGRGGMGVVLRALDLRLEREVALKLVLPEIPASREAIARFVAEAQVTAQLQHPAIVPLFDSGYTEEGVRYYTMRLVAGRTLAVVLDRERTIDAERPSLFRLLQLFVQVCRAVAHAHERGIIHRDLKPANLMLGRFGEVHVMDWGLARRRRLDQDAAATGAPPEADRATASSSRTLEGAILGTPGYMAPEQAAGEASEVGTAADVYSLGAILYAILTGRAPHAGSTAEILAALARAAPPLPPRSLSPLVAEELQAICLAALAPAPSLRTASAAVLAEAVEDYLEGRSAPAAGGEDAEFLRGYRPTDYRRPSLTVDVVLLAGAAVLLQRRARPPFAGHFALPGTFVELDESLPAAAARALRDKTGLATPPPLVQLGSFGEPGRDPRTRVISVVYVARLDAPLPLPPGEAEWLPVASLPKLAFDHAAIVAAALAAPAP